MTTARDIPILITSTASSSERRITPSWTIAHLKTKLEPVTGIAPAYQNLTLRLPDQQEEDPIEAEDEESVQVGSWPLVAYAEIKVGTSGHTHTHTLSLFVTALIFLLDTKPNDYQKYNLGTARCTIELSGLHAPALHCPVGLYPASIFSLHCSSFAPSPISLVISKKPSREASSPPNRRLSRDWPPS